MAAAPSWDKGRDFLIGLESTRGRFPFRRDVSRAEIDEYTRRIGNDRPRSFEFVAPGAAWVACAFVNAREPTRLNYARPGTFRQQRTGRWRPWAGATLWLLLVIIGALILGRPKMFARLPVPAVIVAMFAGPVVGFLALVGGWLLFSRPWRLTAAALLLILLVILLPLVMWLHG